MKRLDKGDDAKVSWRDLGKGQLRVMEGPKGKRVVVRNDVGKVVLNFGLAAGMKAKSTKAGVALVADAGAGPKQYLLRTKEPLAAKDLAPAEFLAG